MKCRLYSHLYHTFIYAISPGFSSAVLFLCNYWLLSIFPLSLFGAARGLPDCQHKLKSWVLAASTEWREHSFFRQGTGWEIMCQSTYHSKIRICLPRGAPQSLLPPSNPNSWVPTWSRKQPHHHLQILTYSLNLSGHCIWHLLANTVYWKKNNKIPWTGSLRLAYINFL